MLTGDGLLVRLHPADGAFSPPQLRGLARAAAEHGNGILEITARGNLQIRGLSEHSAQRLARDVDALGILPRHGIPIETNVLAGLDPDEIADPTPIARDLANEVASAELSAGLGPKVTVVVDGGGRLALRSLTADIRLQALRTACGVEWVLSYGGTAKQALPLGLFSEPDAVEAAARLLKAIAARGRLARGRDLPHHDAQALLHGLAPGVVRPLPHDEDRESLSPPVGVLRLRDGSRAFVAALPFGQVQEGVLEAFIITAESYGTTEFRLAAGRLLVAVGLEELGCAELSKAAERLGLITDAHDPRLFIVACAGAPACAAAHIETKTLAADLAKVLPAVGGLHVSGCAKCCAEPAGRLPAVIGMPDGTVALDRPDGASAAAREAISSVLDRRCKSPPSPERMQRTLVHG